MEWRSTTQRMVAALGPLRLFVSPPGRRPFDVDVQVLENDTYLVLGADPRFRECSEHPIRVHTAALEARPAPPGSVVSAGGGGSPLRLSAIVHDLSREPTWRDVWVEQALVEGLREADRHAATALALPVLGSIHGGIEPRAFVERLERAIRTVRPRALRRIWLQAEPELLGGALAPI